MRTFPPQMRKLHFLRSHKMQLQRREFTAVRRKHQSAAPRLQQFYRAVKGICTQEPSEEMV